MFKQSFKYIVLVIAVFCWIQAYSPLVYRTTGKAGFFPDDYRYGDLYRLSYLPNFKQKAIQCPDLLPKNNLQSPVALYLIGDSFTEEQRVNKHDLRVSKYQYTHWAKQSAIRLDTNQRNILVIETVERTCKEHLLQAIHNFDVNPVPTSTQPLSFRRKCKQVFEDGIAFIFPKGTEERLEHTLFNFDAILWIREMKASLNLKIFGRTEKSIVLDKSESHIFYVDEAGIDNEKSSFYPITATEIDSMVFHLNEARTSYLKAGFDEVYISLIPNKVSVISPEIASYNHLIERIQQHKNLQVPVIDVLSIFKKSPESYYLLSDTHWNCAGRNQWLIQINSRLY